MNKALLKLPLYTLTAGILLRVATAIMVPLLMGGINEWTLEMGTTAFYIQLVFSIALLVGIGILLRQTYSRAAVVRSATLLVAYSIVLLAIEQVTQLFGPYPMLLYSFYLPIEPFTIITSLLARVSGAHSINWLYAIPSLFAPYLLVLFSKRPAPRD